MRSQQEALLRAFGARLGCRAALIANASHVWRLEVTVTSHEARAHAVLVRPIKHLSTPVAWIFCLVTAVAGCSRTVTSAERVSHTFTSPTPVTIVGYDDVVMEAFISRDGSRLFFNNWNSPTVNTNLYVADRVDDTTFRFRGELKGVNTPALEGVPSLDRDRHLYFISTRSYEATLSTIYRGTLDGDTVSNVEIVPGVSREAKPWVNFDAEISADGNVLYFVDGRFGGAGIPETADLVAARKKGDRFERFSGSEDVFRNVNTDALEYAPAISADDLTLIFTRAELGLKGRVALYSATRASVTSPFESPAALVDLDGYVEAATFTPDERAIYYHKKDRGRFVIQMARRR